MSFKVKYKLFFEGGREIKFQPRIGDVVNQKIYPVVKTSKMLFFSNTPTKFNKQIKQNVIDLLLDATLAEGAQIFAILTLVRKFSIPIRKTLAICQIKLKVLVWLNVRPLAVEKILNENAS